MLRHQAKGHRMTLGAAADNPGTAEGQAVPIKAANNQAARVVSIQNRLGRRWVVGYIGGPGDRSSSSAEEPVMPTRCLSLCLAGLLSPFADAMAQAPNAQIGDAVPRDVRELYDKGLQYLVKTQTEKGDWPGVHAGPGVTGMGLMVFLASGEDPNFGLYTNNVRRAVRSPRGRDDARLPHLERARRQQSPLHDGRRSADENDGPRQRRRGLRQSAGRDVLAAVTVWSG